MTLDDNLVGIIMSAEKVEDTNAETIRFRKITVSHGIGDPQQTLVLYLQKPPHPTPLPKDLLIFK